MKTKERITEGLLFVLLVVIFIIALPFLLVYLLFKLLATPFDYITYKHSRYQQDFPQKYKWLREPHIDNEAYTAIRESDLPVAYIKWREDYELNGTFLYKDIVLDFTEPFFFDKKKALWLFWPGGKDDEEVSEDDEEASEDAESEALVDDENTDDCLTVEGMQDFLLDELRSNLAGVACNRVVFFYQRKKAEKNYGAQAVELLQSRDDFIVYEKGELARAIQKFVAHN